ncbi:MAG: arylsulfotransferase family protein [Thermodesulfobacteriota bacterium]
MRGSIRFCIVAAVAALLTSALAACERDTPPASSAPPPEPSAVARPSQPSREEIERLQALGYVDVTDEVVEPGRAGVVVHDRARSQPGYNLFTNAHLCSSQLIDADGKVLRTWALAPCHRWDSTSLTPEGDLLVVGRAHRRRKGLSWAAGRYVARLGFDGSVKWKIDLGAHHDVQWTPHGQIAVLTARPRRVPELDARRRLKDDRLTLLSPDGEVLDSASLYDLLATAPPDQFRFRATARGKGHLDLLHANSVFWMQDPGLAARDPLYAPQNVVVTIRHQDTVAVIDWPAKKVVWAWGQGELSGPHDAVVLPSGNFLVFDNGLGRQWSRVVELDPRTREIVWQYRAPEPETFYTLTRGANQRLANGNTLIAQSDSGRAFEVTPDGDVVWEFLNPNTSEGKRGALVRMRRLEPRLVESWLARDASRAAQRLAADGGAGAAAAPAAH